VDKGFAPAKVNLALHVTGRGQDGYHQLDSAVVFAGVGDQLSATPSRELTLSVSGVFAPGVPTGEENLVLRAAQALRTARGIDKGAAIRLVKNLPHAAGIGGGSSDAAAALRLLAHLWGVAPLPPEAPEVLALGSDVPACLHAPAPVRMRGRGEGLSDLPAFPPAFGMILVNPGAALPTKAVFDALEGSENPPLPDPPGGRPGGDALLAWLRTCRNDLQAPAETLSPAVAEALALLRRTPGVAFATMSGSGPTCVGLTRDMATARHAARTIQLARSRWWVAPAPLLGTGLETGRALAGAQASRATT
jgi:4-diphosphocytidyl-2-C-methyl-D-erythritol kinase